MAHFRGPAPSVKRSFDTPSYPAGSLRRGVTFKRGSASLCALPNYRSFVHLLLPSRSPLPRRPPRTSDSSPARPRWWSAPASTSPASWATPRRGADPEGGLPPPACPCLPRATCGSATRRLVDCARQLTATHPSPPPYLARASHVRQRVTMSRTRASALPFLSPPSIPS